MQDALMAMIARMNKALAMPAQQREQYAAAIARLEEDIRRERKRWHMDAETVEARIAEVYDSVQVSPKDLTAVNWPAAGRALTRIDQGYLDGNYREFEAGLVDLEAALLDRQRGGRREESA